MELGIKPILGIEAYISETDRFDRRTVKKRDDNTQLYNHVILLAENQTGLRNLHRMSELAWTEGFYSKPRMDSDLLEEYSEGIIVLSGCMNGLIAKTLTREPGEDFAARTWIEWFKKTFGDKFFMEVQPHNPPALNAALLELADEYDVQPVITADSHYADEQDREVEDALLILSTKPDKDKGKNYQNTSHLDSFERLNALYPDRTMTFEHIDVYLLSEQEARAAMVAQGFDREDIYENTRKIAGMVGDYEYHKGLDLLPNPVEGDPDVALMEATQKGFEKRAKEAGTRITTSNRADYEARLAEELEVIKQKNFSTYFLIVADVIQWAKKRQIFVGPGRGSAAGSLVCYALGITEVDPLEWDLLFFRFISPDREDYPDIDTDFEDTRRGEVKDYLRKKYGHVAAISTFAVFKNKGVIRDAARVYGVEINEVNKFLKQVPENTQFEDIETMPVAKEFRQKYPDVWELATKLRGRIRQSGMHSAGMVVSKEPIELYAPIETRKDKDDDVSERIPVVAYDMDTCAEIGMIKLDMLGLKTLSVINDCLRLIKKRHGKRLNLRTVDLNDKAVLEDLSDGKTVGVFQADATSYKRLLMRMGVDSFEDLVVSNALVRPGAMTTVGAIYLDRKHGKEATSYYHPSLEPILRDTYGVAIYQEQVMLIAMQLGGLSPADAEAMRNIIGKKKDPKLFEEFRERFVEGASKHVLRSVAEGLWHDFEAHSGYSFNKSHAVAYSKLTFWTAWLKHYYPLEFMYALLRNEKDKDKRTEFLIETKRMNIKVLLPHVNKSDYYFSAEEDAIRFGMTNIKYISDKVAKKLFFHRPYRSYEHLVTTAETKGSGINSRAIAAMNAIGAAVFLDNPRRGDESDNYYEYLNIPKFGSYEWPKHTELKITPLEDYDQDEVAILRVMVKKIKRGKGWSLVEMVDETGSEGIFHDQDTPVQPGMMYFILAAGNRIMSYATTDEAWEALEQRQGSGFLKYLLADQDVPDGQYLIVAFQRRMTKARKLMGTLVLANARGELKKVLVFPQIFGKAYSQLKEGELCTVSISRLKDGGLALQEIL